MATHTITEAKDGDSVILGLGLFGTKAFGSGGSFTDVGYVKGISLTYTRELVEFESAGLLVKRLAFRDRMSMEVEMAEVSIANLALIIPGTSSSTQITFGGDKTITRLAVRFEHLRDDNKIIQVDMYKTVASGEVSLEFAEEEFITFPTTFEAELDTSQTSGEQYGIIQIVT